MEPGDVAGIARAKGPLGFQASYMVSLTSQAL